MNKEYLTVSQLTKYIKYKLDNDINLREVYLKGEISNFKAHTRGHFYFTIKDEGSRINAVMFASSASKVKFTPEDGMKILVTGRISVYEATGGYQIYVNEMMEDGVGNLYVAFEQLKKKLASEGLFDEARKKRIPKIPERVGVITASTGAAIRDIISTINRRFPLTEVILLPSLVQGEGAKEDIVRQIKRAEDYNLDVLIVGRGGGSIEDLWAFNEEIVARAISQCPIPVISAVGHEIDFTIADFVADLRAPTPTGAAEIAVPNKTDVINYINQLNLRSRKAVGTILELKKKRLDNIKEHYILNNPLDLYSAKIQKLDYLTESLVKNYKVIIDKEKIKLNNIKTRPLFSNPLVILDKTKQKYALLLSKLDALSPLKTLERGYGIVKLNDKAVTSIEDLKKDDLINIELKDGSKEAIIK
ncbi:MAG TPA: exodeoxyribonuclease VII large subunit [Candidatus Onthousia excrementipullorum]|uniref:Exodeoxyribonuclease 7 large subunit n=1 Tax=Candidatus Onthousia excrementipullorum TaxID=2840884 RepID=A0A9D1J3C4_9FIRM|nr:exodeoxyribonuclease VII large subunit [Candidatus Onthousia excrementipullorum]